MIRQANPPEIYPSLKSRLEKQHLSLQVILSTITSKRIELKPDPSGWNIHETIAHLVSYQQIFIDQVVQTLSEEVPFFCAYEADADADFKYWRTDDMDHLMTQLISDREKLYKAIFGLTENELSRISMHKKYGSHDILQWTEFFLLHEAHHIYKIFQLAYDIEAK